ncbi:disulfide bond formation protein B [Acinetobacter sp. ANC 3929]|uniref:disulfide bond formation protein B n=1 Tax=unclassified Acinetobacter TaxID=196816 RepID=UPI0002CFC4E5|nr:MULTISPECIES: disulfide bond formation protein B [unclassified Acinetobacter]ENW83211.1 disulfide bond formation protein B [Acinetobacter sp. ANC 3929]MCH7351170.1 disulfide bond formation protein B [Acinetobacter sp. NIPH 2023]MCH7356490.1 disulfide bond formation protein B [Acinetobacter sp. NIPH 1958]MCH7359023.1 disulfide bond formation protein B [Acinetobacter sp. NIPH 2024]
MRWNYRLVSALLVLTSIIGISFALYLEHVQGLDPCPLCIFQRLGLIGMGLIALIAFIHNPVSNAFKRFYAFLATLSIGWSVGVAARHVWLQSLPPDKVPSCGPGLDYLVDALPMKTVLQEVLSGSGECAAVDWTFLGQSLPVWSLVYFSLILLICLWQLFRNYNSSQK